MMASTPQNPTARPVALGASVREQQLLGYDMVSVNRDRRGDPSHGMWAGTVWGTVTSDFVYASAYTTETVQ